MISYEGYLGKKVFLITLKNRKYSGEVIGIDSSNPNGLVWIQIKDVRGKLVTFCTEEIAEFKEDGE